MLNTIRKFAVMLSVSLSLAMSAQSAKAEAGFDLNVWQGAKAFYYPGFTFLDTSPLTRSLTDNSFSSFSGNFITQGGGAYVILNRIIIGGSGYGLSGFRSTSGKGETLALSGGYGVFNLGYQLWSRDGFSIYPVLGIGSGMLSLSSSAPLNRLFGFTSKDDVFRMDTTQVVLDLGIGADYLIDFNTAPEHESGILVGLRLGYLFVPSPPQWEANRQVLGGSLPNLSAQGPYVSLTLGGGTVRHQDTTW